MELLLLVCVSIQFKLILLQPWYNENHLGTLTQLQIFFRYEIFHDISKGPLSLRTENSLGTNVIAEMWEAEVEETKMVPVTDI